jgi:hypothetical protein
MAIAFVQKMKSGSATGAAGFGTVLGTFSSNPIAGNLIVVAVSSTLGTGNISNTLSDTPGNTFTKIGNGTFQSTQNINLYYVQNILGGTNIVKVIGSFTQAWDLGMMAYEYSGVDPSAALDKSAFGTGVSNAASGLGTSGTTATTLNANSLLFAAFTHASNGVGTVGAGWGDAGTIQYQSARSIFCEDKIVSATSAYAGTFSDELVTNYSAGIAVFQQQVAATTKPGWKSLLGVGGQ